MRIVRGLTRSTAGSTDYTHADFAGITPVAASIFCVNSLVVNNPTGYGSFSEGAVTAANQWCTSISEGFNPGGTTRHAVRAGSTNYSFIILDPASTGANQKATATLISGGVRLTWASGESSANQLILTIILYGLHGETAKAGQISLGTGTSAINISTGWPVDFVRFCSIGSGNNYTTTSDSHCILSNGLLVNDGSSSNRMYAASLVGTPTAQTVVTAGIYDNSVMAQIFNEAESWRATAAVITNGFSVTPTANTSSDFGYYLAIGGIQSAGGQVSLKTIDSPVSTGSYSVSGVGFAADYQEIIGALSISINARTSSNDSLFGRSFYDGVLPACSISESTIDGSVAQYSARADSERPIYFVKAGATPSLNFASSAPIVINSSGFSIASFSSIVDATPRQWALLSIKYAGGGGGTYNESISLGLSAALSHGSSANFNAGLTIAAAVSAMSGKTAQYNAAVPLALALQSALAAQLSTSANLVLPATVSATVDGNKVTSGDVDISIALQSGLTTSAQAILGAQLTLASQLLASPAGAGSYATAVSIAHALSLQYGTGNNVDAFLSLPSILSIADAAAVGFIGQLQLGAVLSSVQSLLAKMSSDVTMPLSLDVGLSGATLLDASVGFAWTLTVVDDGAFFEINVTMPTGRVVKILASERMIKITAI